MARASATGGMDRLSDALDAFRCCLDEDIEIFLREKAIEYLQRNWCAVYLIVDEQKFDSGHIKIDAYFTLSHKTLVPFLDSRKKEVLNIMIRLFSQEKVWEMELAATARENWEAGFKEGFIEGFIEGFMEGRADMLRRLLQKFSILEASQITDIPQREIEWLIQKY